jgi:hypothetical protein
VELAWPSGWLKWLPRSPGEASLQRFEENGIPPRRGEVGSSRGVGVAFRVVEVAVPVGHCGVSSNERGSGSLAFPAPSSVLAVAGRTLEVFPSPPLSTGPLRRECCAPAPAEGSLVTFGLSFRALAALPELLAASEEASSSSSRGIRSRAAPLSLDLLRVHSRKPELPSVRSCQGPGSRSALVVSHHLDGLLRAGAAGLLHPAVDSGVRCVSGSGSQELPREVALERPSPSPHRESHPSKSSPHQQPYRITAAVALLPLPHALRVWTARPKPSGSPSPWPRPPARACVLRGRSRSGHSTPARAEALAGASAAAGRGRWLRALGTSGEARELSRPSGDRGRRADPEGSGAHPPRPEPRGWHPPAAGAGDGVEEPVRCTGEAPIRRGGSPRHQAGLGACRRAGRPPSRCARPTTRRWRPERLVSVPAARGGMGQHRPGPGCSPQLRTRAAGASDAARCQAPPSTPLAWSS